MNDDYIINNADKKFHKIYEDKLNDWNKNVITDGFHIEDEIHLEYPIIDGDGITVAGITQDAFMLNKPALVKKGWLKGKPKQIIYRIVIPREKFRKLSTSSDIEFKQYFDQVLKQAIDVIQEKSGFGPESLSVGTTYCTYLRPRSVNTVFRKMENHIGFEMRLYHDSIKFTNLRKDFDEHIKDTNG